ncbi:hypothetical protein RJ639_035015 [Escallonia herrerae]|uniref:Cytochrome P450 n=1 Tax=Escallonia herrerae TaxID=1293975 RepID=A0AA88WPS9_9ASTE|nr:hypothetical protein RJ639_035015 [Escallonia herrerae]
MVHIKTSYGYELMAKSFSVLKKLTDNYRVSRSSYFGRRVGLVELYSQVVGCIDDTSRRVMYESSACIIAILSQVAQGLKAPVSHSLLRLDIRDHDHRSLVGTGSTEVVDAVIEAFLRSQVASIYVTIYMVAKVYWCYHLNIYGYTIDDKVCEHPKEWRPERFLDENKDSVDPYKMTAFGRGKRVCAGALQTMPISCMAIGKFIQVFES